jgi:hypothetical protein
MADPSWFISCFPATADHSYGAILAYDAKRPAAAVPVKAGLGPRLRTSAMRMWSSNCTELQLALERNTSARISSGQWLAAPDKTIAGVVGEIALS